MVVALAHRRPRRRGPLGDVREAAALSPLSRWRAAGGRSTTREGLAAPPAYARSYRRGDASGTGNERGERRQQPERGGAATLGVDGK